MASMLLEPHTEPVAAMHFHMYSEAQKSVPPATNIRDETKDYSVLAGVPFNKQKRLQACQRGREHLPARRRRFWYDLCAS